MCSGTLRKRWDADSCWLLRGGIVREGAGADVAQNSLIQCQWLCWEDLNGEMELCHWSDVGKPNQLWLHLPWRVMGKGCSVSPGSVSSSRLGFLCSEFRSGCNCWLFPAYTNFSQLRALGMIYFTPECKDFMWAFPFHPFWLWFGVCCIFFFFLFSVQGEIPNWIQRLWNCSGVRVLGTGTWLCLLLPVLGWERVLCPSPPVYPLGRLGELGQRDGLEPDPLLGQLLDFLGAGSLCQQCWNCPCSPGSSWQQLSVLPSGCSLTGYKLSCSADIKYQEVQITPNFQF